MKVESIMTSPVHSCSPQDSLVTAAEIMWEADCGCVPVVDEEHRIVGIITDRDICMRAYFGGTPLRTGAVESTMSSEVETCHPNASVEEAAAIMARKQLRRLPVVDDGGRVLGIVSLNDLALALQNADQEMGSVNIAATLAAISRHRPNIGSAKPH